MITSPKFAALLILLLALNIFPGTLPYHENVTSISVFEEKLYIFDAFSAKITIFTFPEERSFEKKEIDLEITPEYDFVHFLPASPLSSYLLDDQGKALYRLDEEYHLLEKHQLQDFSDIDLATKFYTPSYNSLLLMDKSNNDLYLLENGRKRKVIAGHDDLKNFYCHGNNIYCLYPSQVKMFNAQGVLLKKFNFTSSNEGEKLFALKDKFYILCQDEIIEIDTKTKKQELIPLSDKIKEFTVIKNKLIYFNDKEIVIRKLK